MYRNQKGSAGIIALGLVGAIVLAVVLGVVWAIGLKNEFVRLESDIIASNQGRQANLSQYTLRIMEMVKVPKMQREDLTATIEAQIKARYGQDGSKAVFQVLKENNIAVTPELYTNIQKEISGGRKDYEQNEKRLTESKRIACNRIQTSPGDVVLRAFGYPTLHFGCKGDKDDYPVIMSESSKDTFSTGVDKGVSF
jgi:hypothetical protein